MRFLFSPEFQRNLWLQFSPFRMVAAPVVLILCAIVAINLGDNVRYGNPSNERMGFLLYTMLSIYCAVVIVWGTFEAANAMHSEIRSNTWDFQCMSSISPIQLALGKLFGATSYTWFVGLQALAVFAYAYANYVEGSSWRRSPAQDDTLYVVAGFALAGLAGQAAAFLVYFMDLTVVAGRTTRSRLPGAMSAFFTGLVVSVIVFTVINRSATHIQTRNKMFRADIEWYGNVWDYKIFVITSLLFFLAWFLLGAVRLARAELMYRNLPYVWLLFVLSFVAWSSGFFFRAPQPIQLDSQHGAPVLKHYARNRHEIHAGWAMFWACIQASIMSYGAMLMEAGDRRKYARLIFYADAGDFRQMFENMPKWLVTVPVIFVFYFAVIFAVPEGVKQEQEIAQMTTFMAAFILFLLRDGLVVHAIQRAVGRGSARFAVVFYYVVVYGLIPMAVMTAADVRFRQFMRALFELKVTPELGGLVSFLYPVAVGDPVSSILPPLGQAFLAGAWLHYTLRGKLGSGVIANPKA